MRASNPTPEQVASSEASVSNATRIAEASVTMEEAVREFGEERLTIEEDGSWNVHLEGREEVERFEEMDQKRSRLEEGFADAALAKRKEVVVKDRNGNSRLMSEEVANSLGLHPAPYWGRPKYRVKYVNGQRVETRFR